MLITFNWLFNPDYVYSFLAIHNKSRLLYNLVMFVANIMNSDQTVPLGSVFIVVASKNGLKCVLRKCSRHNQTTFRDKILARLEEGLDRVGGVWYSLFIKNLFQEKITFLAKLCGL